MGTVTQYPMNFYSRSVTNSSGTSPSTQYFLCHADRALVTTGSVFIDQSSYDHQVLTRGSAILQSTVAVYFGTSGILFTGSTASADAARILWTMTASTATGRAMQLECVCYLTSLNSAGMVWWDFRNSGNTNYASAKIWQDTDSVWKVNVEFYQAALGKYLSGNWAFSTFTTGTPLHLVLVRNNSSELGGSNRMTIFHNGSELSLLSGGFPSDRSGNWLGCGFDFPPSDRFALGGTVNSAAGVNPYSVFPGWMDEIRYLVDTFEGVTYNTVLSAYVFAVPTAPYLPADGTFNITAKSLVLNSTDLSPASDGLLSLGQTGTQWKNLWSNGTAYFNQIGQVFTVVGSFHAQFRDTTTYMFSSATGYLTLVAGTQIDLQANIGISGKNFIFDTGTGVKVATATNQKFSFWGATPVVQETALTAQLTTITCSAPTTPDYAIADLTQVTPYGFVSLDEGQTLLKVIANLQTRLSELETKLKNYGLLP